MKNVKLSYLVGSVDKNNTYFHMTCLLPKYWKLLPLIHTFIDHAVQHKNAIKNQYHSLFEISQTKHKKKSTMKQWESVSKIHHNKFIYLNTSTNEVI